MSSTVPPTSQPPSDAQGTSTRPYLIRALHDWCTDNGFTPYLAVFVGPGVQVPMEYVKNNEIVLNVGFEATSALKLGNDFIEFKARFGGVAREILVPVDHVVAIYARENGQGMAFPMPTDGAGQEPPEADASAGEPRAPARGLRLASVEGQSADEASVAAPEAPAPEPVSSSPAVPPAADTGDGDRGGDDTPPPAGAGRPALKRVK